MDLFHTIILILGAAQLIGAQPLENSTSSVLITTPEALSRYFDQEYGLLAPDTAHKLKNMSEQILNDTTIQQAETLLIQEFKRNISSFQEIYEIYEKFNLYKEALLRFSEIISPFYNQELVKDNDDAQYIFDLIKKLNYDNINDEFEKRFINLMKNTFLPKLKELKSFISPNKTQHLQEFLKWSKCIKECADYVCFRKYIVNLDKIVFTPKKRFYGYVNQQLQELNIFYGGRTLSVVKDVIKNPKINELPQDTKHYLLQNISDFITNYERNQDLQEFIDMLPLFYQNVIIQFYRNDEETPLKEQQLLNEIFDESGYAQFQIDYRKKFQDFLDYGIADEFENYRAFATAEELLKEKELIDWFEHFKSLSTIMEKQDLFDELFDIMERNE